MKKYTVGDNFVLRSANDLKLAAKKLEDDGYQVFADDGKVTRNLVEHVINFSLMENGSAVIGIDKDGDVIVGSPDVVMLATKTLYFGDVKPQERSLIG